MHAREHPQITFSSTGLARDGDQWLLRGQITVRGHTAPAELAITAARTDEAGLLVKATAAGWAGIYGLHDEPGGSLRWP